MSRTYELFLLEDTPAYEEDVVVHVIKAGTRVKTVDKFITTEEIEKNKYFKIRVIEEIKGLERQYIIRNYKVRSNIRVIEGIIVDIDEYVLPF